MLTLHLETIKIPVKSFHSSVIAKALSRLQLVSVSCPFRSLKRLHLSRPFSPLSPVFRRKVHITFCADIARIPDKPSTPRNLRLSTYLRNYRCHHRSDIH